jgi:hypothetical protein
MHVRARGVQAFLARNIEIGENAIDYSGSRAIAVHLHGTSSTLARRNTITGLPTPVAMYHRGVPGVDRQLGCATCALLSIYPSQAFSVINVIIEGALLQFPNTIDGKSEDNRFVENTVRSPVTSAGGIYVAVRSVNTLVANNDVSGAAGIVLAGFPLDTFLNLPGTCSGDPARYCGVTPVTGIDDHCAIPGIDTAPKGTCTVRADCAALGGAAQPNGTCRVNQLDGRAVDARILDNRIDGPPTATGISIGNQLNPLVRGNVITGVRLAINVGGRSLEQGEISRNTLEAPVGLLFTQGDAQLFGARISVNDVIAATPIEAGGGAGACQLGDAQSCQTTSDCPVDFCRADGRCNLNVVARCQADAECTLVNQCVMFSHAAELSVGHCSLDASVACSTDSDCVVGACADEPARSCRNDNECRTAGGRSPAAGACGGKTGRGVCTDPRGNHWARSCADSDGFRAAGEKNRCAHDGTVSCAVDEDCGPGGSCIVATDSRSPLVVDSHPFGVPVAGTPDGELPSTCL